MNTSVTSDAPQGDAPEGEVPKTGGSTVWDALFMVFLVLMLAFVAWVGMLSFAEGMKNEVTKRNGEAWAKWLGDASAERFKPGFAVAECAAGASAEAVAAASPAAAKEAAKPEDAAAPPASENSNAAGPKLWGECLKVLIKPGAPLAELVNPFSEQALDKVVVKCDPADHAMAGALVLEKITTTPLGSAVPTIYSPLADSDPIGQKLQLRVTVCDKGSYPVRIAEFDF